MSVGREPVPAPTPPKSVQAMNTGTVARFVGKLATWRQGDLIGRPEDTDAALPLSWVMPADAQDPVTGQRNGTGVVAPYFHPGSFARFVVVSQTCDVSGADTGRSQPFFLAAPLASNIDLDAAYAAVSKGTSPYLLASTYTDPAEPSLKWAVDLRFIAPMSKGVLLRAQSGGPAFTTDGLMRLAASLAQKFGRPAVDDALVLTLPAALDAHVVAKGADDAVFASTDEVRLQVTGGTTLGATAARVVVLVDKSVVRRARKLWVGWEPPVRAALAKKGIKLGATLVTTADAFKASDYRATSALRVTSLGPRLWA